jgi:hypothetical protein
MKKAVEECSSLAPTDAMDQMDVKQEGNTALTTALSER